MVGIKRFGAYIPYYRLSRELISRVWGMEGGRGERSVAYFDEDSATMAVEAGIDCLRGADREEVDGLFFASTTSPYSEKQCATLVATAADLHDNILTADFANSLRAGTTALRTAVDAVKAGSASNILVAAADQRTGYPRSNLERDLGDGAAAFLVGDTDVVAELEGFTAISDEITDIWRTNTDRFVRTWEDRWVREHGYMANIRRAVSSLMNRMGLHSTDIAWAVIDAPDARSQRTAARALNLEGQCQIQDLLLDSVGVTGCGHALLMLAACLEKAGPGERLLVVSYGSGAEALLFRITDAISSIKGPRGVSGHITRKAPLSSYEKYLWFRGLVEVEPPSPILVDSSATAVWRDRNSIIRLRGSRCLECGLVQHPVQRVCDRCGVKDRFEEIRLSDQPAELFSFSLDNFGAQVDPPMIQSVVDTRPGARIFTTMVDVDPSEVRVGMPVEMTFRRTREASGFHQYYWKCRPAW